jgi:hypothetical protein
LTIPLPIFTATSSHIGNILSESFKRRAIGLLVIEDKSNPVACRLIVHLPQAPGGVASATILEATVPGPFSPKKVP